MLCCVQRPSYLMNSKKSRDDKLLLCTGLCPLIMSQCETSFPCKTTNLIYKFKDNAEIIRLLYWSLTPPHHVAHPKPLSPPPQSRPSSTSPPSLQLITRLHTCQAPWPACSRAVLGGSWEKKGDQRVTFCGGNGLSKELNQHRWVAPLPLSTRHT